MRTFKLPRILAIIGIGLGLTFATLYWYNDKYNPFHVPTWEQAPPNYSVPALYSFLEKLMFALCPGLFLQVFTVHTGKLFTMSMWAMAILMNGPVYYCIGLIVTELMSRGWWVAHRSGPSQ